MSPARRRAYAAETGVPVERSKQQLEQLLRAHDADGYHAGWDATRDVVEFLWKGNQIRFELPRPTKKDHQYTPGGLWRSEKQVVLAMQQADRQRWRALYLVIRAKLEAVEAGIAIFEQEFLSFIVVPGRNQTIGEIMVPRIKAGEMDSTRLLAAPAETPA